MSIETSIVIISVLVFLLLIQISVLLLIKKLITKLSVLAKEVNASKVKLLSKNLVPTKIIKTCQNCQFRQSFFRHDEDLSHSFFYLCRLKKSETKLEDSCTKFELETTKTK